jgi:hypothetical protein
MFIKITFNSTTRKLKLEDKATLAQLKTELVRCFGEKVADMSLGYEDSESELIAVTSQEDWEVCLEEFKEKNKGKPSLNVTLQLIQNEDFVTIGDSKITKTQETAPVETESEIKEEVKETKPVEVFPEDKIILETKETTQTEEITEKKEEAPQAYDEIIETEINIPEESFNRPEDLQNLIKNVTDTLGSFGINVDVIDARVEPAHKEESHLNESTTSRLTQDQRTEIEDMIDEKVHHILNMKKDKKNKKDKKDNKEKKNKKTGSFTHNNIICDGCKQNIKDMARFKSLVINDYDLCEECEKTGIHPGPMVKFNTPSNYNPFQLNNKFREIIPYFKNDTEKKEEETFEGFQMFPGCPFRGQRRGGCRRFPDRPHGPRQGPAFAQRPQAPAFLQNLSEGFKPFGGLLNNIIQNLTTELTKHTQPAPAAPQQTHTMTENKQADDQAKILAEDFVAEFADMGLDVEVLTSIIKENHLLSKDAIMNHLFL